MSEIPEAVVTDVRVVRGTERTGFAPVTQNTGIENIIEALGLGLGQLVIISVAMGAFIVDGLVAIISNQATDPIASKLASAATGVEREMCCLYVGRLVGTIVTGLTADKLGLSNLINASFAVLTFFIMLASYSNSVDWFLQTRFMLGMAMGFGQAPALALVFELVPHRWKTFVISLTFLSSFVGSMLGYAILMTDDSPAASITNTLPMMDEHWRSQIRLAAIPSALLFLFSLAYIPDSPSWLATHGDIDLARDLLKRIRSMNSMEYVPVLFRKLHIHNGVEQTKTIIMSFPMFALCFTSFTMCFIMTGMNFTFPFSLQKLLVRSDSEFVGPTVQVFGFVAMSIAILLGTTCYAPPNPKTGLLWSAAIGGIAMALFYFLNVFPSAAFGTFALPMLAVIGLAAAPVLALIFVYKIAAELCPVNCTAIGLSVVLGAGQVGTLLFFVFQQVAPASFQVQVYSITTVACLCILLLVGPAQFVPWGKPIKSVQFDVQHDGDEFIFSPASNFDGHKGIVTIVSESEEEVAP